MKNVNNNKAFTLIETLVAISILMIAIAGPLTIASKAYTAAIDARNQSIASNLAQEGLEYINNMKDNRQGGWATWEPDEGSIDPSYVNCYSFANNCPVPGTDLVPVTGFTRRFYLSWGDQSANHILATVGVTWKTGMVSNSVQVQQILSNYHR